MEEVTKILEEIGAWIASVNWEEVFNTVKDVVTKIVEFVSNIAAK